MVNLSEEKIRDLVGLCIDARKHSYSPYSNFRVGASLLDEDGTIWNGVNVENCAYSPGICAERTAFVKAVSEGKRKFVAIAISSDMEDQFIYPCGVCRQFMVEFGKDLMVISTKPDGTYQYYSLSDLLPHAFMPKHLEVKRESPMNSPIN